MNKNKSRRYDDDKDKEERLDSEISEALPSEEPDIQRAIEIAIESIENISSIKMICKEGADILIRVQHDEITLGKSPSIKLNTDGVDFAPVNIDYTILFTIVMNNQSAIGTVVSTPILITVLESLDDNFDGIMTPAGNVSVGDVGSKNKGKRSSALKLKSLKANQGPVILGICNFDLMPLLLGEKAMTEKLLIEVPSYNNGEEFISWENLPHLTLSARLRDAEIFPPDTNVNFLTITVESIYNLPSSFTDDMDYKASTVIYVADEVSDDIIFNGGVRTSIPDIEKIKYWQSLAHLEGRAKFSKYKLNSDITKNHPKDEFDMKLSENAPRVQWNSMRRSLILNPGCQIMTNKIIRYKYWPFFFAASEKVKDASKQKEKETDNVLLFQCYADVSELLYPGTTRTRTVAQLHTFSISTMAERTGLDKSVFGKEISKEPAIKEKALKKGKSSTKGSSLSAIVAISMESDYVPSFPLISENGQPVFVIIEFELHRPLQPARTLEDLTNCIDEMVHPYILSHNPYNSDLAEEHYSNCIRKLVDTLCEAYQDFVQNRSVPSMFEKRPHKDLSPTKIFDADKDSGNNSTCYDEINSQKDCKYSYIKDEIECFIQYLHETGSYLSVRSTLKNKITMLLDQKFKIEMYTLSKKECQNFVATTYVYLVEQMHRTINNIVEGQHAGGFTDSSPISNLSFCAEESCALGYIDEACKEYLNMITRDNKNPDTWIEYAIYLIRIKDIDRARECCCEAIALNKQHKIALLLYGLILWQKEQYREAEIFLHSVIQIYPRFAEGWSILHLFYLRTEYFPGVDATIQVARKCIKDKDPDIITMPLLNREPLLWTTLNYPKDRIYLVTAVLLMKLYCLDFAGIALAQDFAEMGRTRHFLYYMAVLHYIENRYEDAICHLKEAVTLHGMEFSIASLMGHCHLEEGNFDEATYCYEFANSLFDRPEDLHLAQLRLGYQYLNTDQYETAKKLLLIICKNSPTYRSWLGVGIAFYHLSDMKNAEKSLTEANNLNIHNAEVWGYLCLVNMTLQRYDEFLHCYQQVIKNNLTNVRVWTMIKNLMDSLGYMIPVLSIDSQEGLIHESLENDVGHVAYQEPDNK